jgi:PTS system nitrogen regulatory IIA component
MRITDILAPELVLPDVPAGDKDTVLRHIAAQIQTQSPALGGADRIHSALMNRERLGSTGVGAGVAIPHAKLDGLDRLVACFARVRDGLLFDAIDDDPVRLVFVLLVPEHSTGDHLKALARVSRLLRDAKFRASLLDAADGAAIYQAFRAADEA